MFEGFLGLIRTSICRAVAVGFQQARTRRPLTNRPLGLRAQRKRAVDFFGGDSAVQTRDSTDTSLSRRVGVGNGDAQSEGGRAEKRAENSSSDVLETAYRAAVAMTASAELDTAPPKDRVAVHDAKIKRSTSPELNPESAHKESTSSARALEQPFAPPLNIERKPKAAPPVTKSRPVLERETGAVDAEGLIWVNESQGTAYSVRCVPSSEPRQALCSSLRLCVLSCFPLRTNDDSSLLPILLRRCSAGTVTESMYKMP